MGGGFGIKTHLYPEDLVVAWLARRLGRPVKWVQTRREDFLASNYCRDHRIAVDVAADADGRLLGLRARIVMDAGAYSILPGFGSMLEAAARRQILGPYRIPAYAYEASCIVTNKVPRGAYRGVAMVTTTFSMERVMDLLAKRTGLDPVEVRRRNLISAGDFPYRNVLGVAYESASFQESLTAGLLRLLHRATSARSRSTRGPRAARLGLGIAVYAEFTAPNSKALALRGIVRVPGFDYVSLRVDPSGKARAYTSVTAMGQGIQTALAQLIADELGIDIADVTVETGDSTLAPYGSGAFASRGPWWAGAPPCSPRAGCARRSWGIAAADLEAPAQDLVVGGRR